MSQPDPSLIENIARQYGLRRGNGRWSGPCPKCGGSNRSDKFVMRDDGGFKCYGCEFKGDLITWLRQMESLSCPDAHERAGLACRSAGCAVRAGCRLGDGQGQKKITRRPGRGAVQLPAGKDPAVLPAASAKDPEEIWRAWAEKVQQLSAGVLMNYGKALEWLAGRGISAEVARAAGLGWREHDSKMVREEIGLPEKNKPTLWVPGGLVIPTWSMEEPRRLIRLRIRRTAASRQRFLPELKYVWIEGSGTAPMIIPAREQLRGVVIVEAELDGIAVAAAHPGVTVVALGTVAAGLPEEVSALLAKAPVILVALDADPHEGRGSAAGQRAMRAWQATYRQARYWPPPAGKDPGEYVAQGGDLAGWIEAGLPPAPVVAVPGQVEVIEPPKKDLGLSPGESHQGDRGGQNNSGDMARVVTLTDGRELYLTDDRAEYARLQGEGRIVFTSNEMDRLKTATAGMDARERAIASLLAVDLKETFALAYIRAGRSVAGAQR